MQGHVASIGLLEEGHLLLYVGFVLKQVAQPLKDRVGVVEADCLEEVQGGEEAQVFHVLLLEVKLLNSLEVVILDSSLEESQVSFIFEKYLLGLV